MRRDKAYYIYKYILVQKYKKYLYTQCCSALRDPIDFMYACVVYIF